MELNTLLALIIAATLFAIAGITSIYKSHIIGAEFYWFKYKYFYIPKF